MPEIDLSRRDIRRQTETRPISKENPFEIESPPFVDLGYLPDELLHTMTDLANKVVENPGYAEKGRLSRLIPLHGFAQEFEDLAQFANSVSAAFLKSKPRAGSATLLSVVTDAEEFKKYTEMDKAASSWHQDFDTTATGFYFPTDSRTRLVIPLSAGTIYATGNLSFDNITQIASGQDIRRSDALDAGQTVIGADGVLVRSEVDPTGGTIHIAEPGKAYVIPKQSVHKSPPLPTGRIFFQLDAF